MNSNKTTARIFGVFFLLAFLAYGFGSGIAETITNSPGGLTYIYNNKSTLIIGAILMALVHTFLNIGLAVIMFRTLKQYNGFLAFGYLSAAISATVILIFGAIFLFLLVPLSDEFVKAIPNDIHNLQSVYLLFKKGNFFAYQLGMAIWGLGGLMLCYLLYLSKLVPRPIAIWGFIGYIIFIAGTILELFGNKLGLIFDIPGGLFEIFLSIWLIVKGFNNSKVNITD